jgi:hypothetical protein
MLGTLSLEEVAVAAYYGNRQDSSTAEDLLVKCRSAELRVQHLVPDGIGVVATAAMRVQLLTEAIFNADRTDGHEQ